MKTKPSKHPNSQLNTYSSFATKNDQQDDNALKEKGRLSDIIIMSQNISGDWLRKVGEKILYSQLKRKGKIPVSTLK